MRVFPEPPGQGGCIWPGPWTSSFPFVFPGDFRRAGDVCVLGYFCIPDARLAPGTQQVLCKMVLNCLYHQWTSYS